MLRQTAQVLVDIKKTPEWEAIEFELSGRDKEVVERLMIALLKKVGYD